MVVQCEQGFDDKYVEGFRQKGHNVVNYTDISVLITGISRIHGQIEAVSDPRNGGGGVEIN